MKSWWQLRLYLPLAALIALECAVWLMGGAAPPAPSQSGITTAGERTTASAQSETTRRLLLDRPLFSASRRPPAALATASAGAPAPRKAPRLAGVLASPAGRTAILADADNGKTTAVQANQRFGPFTVLGIAEDSVTLDGPDGRQTLFLSFTRGQRLIELATPQAARFADRKPDGAVLAPQP